MTAASQPGEGYPVRDEGDAWVEGPEGQRFWGRFGAAGLLAYDPGKGVLLQHRVSWSHFGGTWALPGGARHRGESAIDGAIREAHEEAGVPRDALQVIGHDVFDLGFWSYVTVIAIVTTPFTPVISDAESVELEWVPLNDVAGFPLHPNFANRWPLLQSMLPQGH